jgi:hypothetical protein
MDSRHLQQLIELCERLPESELIRLNRGLKAFFAKNPITEATRSHLNKITGGLEWNQAAVGLAVSVGLGLFAWYAWSLYSNVKDEYIIRERSNLGNPDSPPEYKDLGDFPHGPGIIPERTIQDWYR